ncbi:ABC transporter substrate-binding protein [Pseudoroseicyclus sp. CLL3-39]|uniref:ABC transporter substrate-binding protein n=2 Tax=Pseudoroseicyclus tamaricis TaxID=2705421 RepID=A0A6B2K316_9RHOB|nr:extracellular solute-binding protein [Pseudoroseicyclus tamaricis]NDV00886.1 ABC transporter substrate-binding protein [Pseudoroseicyclus tamaricis]
MYGEPALPQDFEALPYANPEAPIGGSLVEATVGSFDSLNPWVRKGNVPWQLRYVIGESLMGRTLDEPFTLYGVLAESIEVGPNRDWVEFTLNPAAEFQDGSPVTVEDVIWSFETLGTEGHGRYAGFWSQVESIEETGERSVRLTFSEENPELPLLAGLRPILKKAQWEGVDFAETGGTDIVPIVSSPYIIGDFEPGRYLELERNPDYWGWDIPFRRGTYNLDSYRIEFFGDETAAFEAFKTGEVTFTREFNVARWESNYDFPRVESGEVTKETFTHSRPSGMTGFVMNTRREPFEDWRVRQAMIELWNFEFINETMTGAQQPRITSYFSNSPLGMTPGTPAEGTVAELLEPFAEELYPGALEGYALPVSDGTERNRPGVARALELMEEAGYTVQDGVMTGPDGEPFSFEILTQTGVTEQQAMVDIFEQAVEGIGIDVSVEQADSAQFTERTQEYEFDMTYYRVGLSLSPGNEQYLYFGSEQAETGGRNAMGVASPAVDAMIDELLNAESQDNFYAAAKALDRALMAGRYVIPIYQWNNTYIAYNAELAHPDRIPLFGDWPGWLPDVWWSEAAAAE